MVVTVNRMTFEYKIVKKSNSVSWLDIRLGFLRSQSNHFTFRADIHSRRFVFALPPSDAKSWSDNFVRILQAKDPNNGINVES